MHVYVNSTYLYMNVYIYILIIKSLIIYEINYRIAYFFIYSIGESPLLKTPSQYRPLSYLSNYKRYQNIKYT